MTSYNEALAFALTLPDTYAEEPFRNVRIRLARYKYNKKGFVWCHEADGEICIDVRADADRSYFWRSVYPSVRAGYISASKWITVVLDGSIPDDDIRLMIEESYTLVSDTPSKRIYEAVKRIPYGRVATYGQVAAAAGDRKMARAVGNALHRNPDPDNIPCFRVVNAKGELAGEFAFGGPGEQAGLLEAEGVEVTDGRVDLGRFQWKEYR